MISADEILGYYRDRYQEELFRFKEAEEKSHKFMNFLAIIIAAIAVMLSGIMEKAPIKELSFAVGISLFSFLVMALFLISATASCLKCMRVGSSKAVPKSIDMHKYLSSISDHEAKDFISICYRDAALALAEQIDEKLDMLVCAYRDIKLGGFSFVIFFVSFSINGVLP